MTGHKFLKKEQKPEEQEEILQAGEEKPDYPPEITSEKHDLLENKPFSKAFQEKKEEWFDRIPLSVRQLDIIIYAGIAALIIVFILIGLEAAGIFKI